MTSDWVMVIITGLYVVATVFICCANFKSANASKEQLKEMQRQYNETNRPLIETEFHYSQKTWYIVRFNNHGERTAQHVKIELSQEFIDSLPEESFKAELDRLQGKECIIGARQHYDLFIGSNKLRGNPNMKPVKGIVEYEAQGVKYKSDIYVDLEHYMTFYSVKDDEEKQLELLKSICDELKRIKQAIIKNSEKKAESQNYIPDDKTKDE